MREKIYKIILIVIILLTIFLLPTGNIITNIVIRIFNIDNVYFDTLVKIAIFLLIVFIYELDIKNSIQYGKIYEFKTQKFARNPIKYIILVTLATELIISVFLRILDLTGKIEVSSNTWIGYISSILGMTLTAIGVIITLNKYFKDKEEKESPKLLIRVVNNPKIIKYTCDLGNVCSNLIKKIYIELVNKGDSNIYLPTLMDDENQLKEIYRKDVDNQILDLIEPPNQGKDKKYIIELNIRYEEGTMPTVCKYFEIIYNSSNYNEYMTNFRVEFHRHDDKKANIICEKQLRNYDRILGMG